MGDDVIFYVMFCFFMCLYNFFPNLIIFLMMFYSGILQKCCKNSTESSCILFTSISANVTILHNHGIRLAKRSIRVFPSQLMKNPNELFSQPNTLVKTNTINIGHYLGKLQTWFKFYQFFH